MHRAPPRAGPEAVRGTAWAGRGERKAVRKRTGLKIAATDPEAHKNLAMELADCLIYLFDIANLADVDLDLAFRSKEELNSRKVWTVSPDTR